MKTDICTKCGSNACIVVYRRPGASWPNSPETWLCAVCAGTHTEREPKREPKREQR